MPTVETNARTRVVYRELGMSVEHRRVDELGGALTPVWLAAALDAAD